MPGFIYPMSSWLNCGICGVRRRGGGCGGGDWIREGLCFPWYKSPSQKVPVEQPNSSHFPGHRLRKLKWGTNLQRGFASFLTLTITKKYLPFILLSLPTDLNLKIPGQDRGDPAPNTLLPAFSCHLLCQARPTPNTHIANCRSFIRGLTFSELRWAFNKEKTRIHYLQ